MFLARVEKKNSTSEGVYYVLGATNTTSIPAVPIMGILDWMPLKIQIRGPLEYLP